MQNKKDYNKAILYVMSGYISIAIMGIFVKLASNSIPSSEILFSRFFLGAILMFPFMLKGKHFSLDLSKIHFFILRNLAGIGSMLLMFYTMKFLPVSISMLLMNTSALFVPLILFFFGIKTTFKQVFLIILGFLGISIILLGSQTISAIESIYIGYCLISAFLAACAYCSLQELNKYNSPQNIVFYFHVIGSLLVGGLFFYDWQGLSLYEAFLLICVALFGLFFQIFVTKAFKFARANDIIPFTFVGVIFSSLFDAFFLDIHLPLSFWIGTMVVVIAISLLAKINRSS